MWQMMHMRSIGIWNRVMEICCLAGSIRLFIMCTMEQFNVVLCPSLPSLLPCSCVVSEISTNSGWPLNAKKDVTGSQLSNKRKMISAAGWCCLSGSNKRWLHWLDRRWMITSCKKTTPDARRGTSFPSDHSRRQRRIVSPEEEEECDEGRP